jgi:hypothetical protein
MLPEVDVRFQAVHEEKKTNGILNVRNVHAQRRALFFVERHISETPSHC